SEASVILRSGRSASARAIRRLPAEVRPEEPTLPDNFLVILRIGVRRSQHSKIFMFVRPSTPVVVPVLFGFGGHENRFRFEFLVRRKIESLSVIFLRKIHIERELRVAIACKERA